MLFGEDSFISFKMHRLPELHETLAYTKPDAGSVPVTLALCCLLEGRGKIEVPDCNVAQKALSGSTYYIKQAVWRQNRFGNLQKLWVSSPSYVRSQTNINHMDLQHEPSV